MVAIDKPRSLNRSCIQCRERKIKCDRGDPCSQCTSKGSPDDCKKELRKKRAKNKRPFPKRKSRAAPTDTLSTTSSRPSATLESRTLPAFSAWAEQAISPDQSANNSSTSDSVTAHTPSTSASIHQQHHHIHSKQQSHVHQAGSTSYHGHLSPSSSNSSNSSNSSDFDSDDSDDDDTPNDDCIQTHEAAALLRLQTAPEAMCPFALKDVYADWRNMSLEQRRDLIQEIRQVLPSLDITTRIIDDIYQVRVHSLFGSVVHLPLVKNVLTELITDPHFEHRQRYAFGVISSALMVVVLGLHFVPFDRPFAWEKGFVLKPFHHKELRMRQKKLHLIVKRLIKFESGYTFGSIAELQTAILLLSYQKGSEAYLDAIADAAIRSAMRMRLHRLGTLQSIHSSTIAPTKVVAGEMAIRCWWYLVRRDWSQSHKHRSYRILPTQFTTRQPLNLFDEELLVSPLPQSHPRSTWTYVSYSLAMVDYSVMTRTMVDQVSLQPVQDIGPASFGTWGLASIYGQKLDQTQRDAIDHMFQAVIASFPAHYSLDTGYAELKRIDVERWLLHQRLFLLFLQLHMPLLSEAERPHGSLIFMANHILEIQGKVANVCPALDNLRLNTLHSLRACIVLLHELFWATPPNSISGLTRLMTRRKVDAALEKLPSEQSSSTVKLCIQLVRALLGIEEQQFQNHVQAGRAMMQAFTDGSPLVQSADRHGDAALKTRWRATCQILDVLMNEGYWRSFRKNLADLDHLIPEWLLKPFQETSMFDRTMPAHSPEGMSGVDMAGAKDRSSEVRHVTGPSIASMLSPMGAADELSNPTNAIAGMTPNQDGRSITSAIDPYLVSDADFLRSDLMDNASLFPSMDMELIGPQDFEGWQNASISLDFEKMLKEWKTEVPLMS